MLSSPLPGIIAPQSGVLTSTVCIPLFLFVPQIIPGFALGFFAVFNRFGRTAGNTGHTVGAVLPPCGFPAHQFHIVQRTAGFASSTSGASIRHGKALGADH